MRTKKVAKTSNKSVRLVSSNEASDAEMAAVRALGEYFEEPGHADDFDFDGYAAYWGMTPDALREELAAEGMIYGRVDAALGDGSEIAASDWTQEARELFDTAHNTLVAYYALLAGRPTMALSWLTTFHVLENRTYRGLLHKLAIRDPETAAGLYLGESDLWGNPYYRPKYSEHPSSAQTADEEKQGVAHPQPLPMTNEQPANN